MHPNLLLRAAAVMLLTAGAWIVLEGSTVSAQTLPQQYAQKEEKSVPFGDCVRACIHRLEAAKAECAASEKKTHNYDVSRCVLDTETHVVDCIRACTPSAQ